MTKHAMFINKLLSVRDFFHAQFCYQLFITPLGFKVEPEYQDFATRGCEFISLHRSNMIKNKSPRHHVVHHFGQKHKNAKKILIAHGWTSRAAYMVRTIRLLHQEGYEVYALDFPAHGDARGFQLPWVDAVMILRNILNNFGPFYGIIGHSFGGSMLLNTLNLANQLPEWHLDSMPERAVFMASPTKMHTIVRNLAERLKLSPEAFAMFCEMIRRNAPISLKNLHFRHFVDRSAIPIFCIHGQRDTLINPNESIYFCRKYPHASLALLPDLDHIGVLIDKRVEHMIGNFLG